MKKIIFAMILLACAAQVSAGSLYKCVDVTGNTAYQENPCAELPTNKANYPIEAKQITEKIALDTVTKFYAAVMKRDAAAATRFVAQKFSVQTSAQRGRVFDNNNFFATYIGDMVRATKGGVDIGATCKVLKAADNAVTLACIEKTKSGDNPVRESYAEYTVVIDNGAARFSHLTVDKTK